QSDALLIQCLTPRLQQREHAIEERSLGLHHAKQLITNVGKRFTRKLFHQITAGVVEILLAIPFADANQFALYEARSRDEDDKDLSVCEIHKFNMLQDRRGHWRRNYDSDVFGYGGKYNGSTRHHIFGTFAFGEHPADVPLIRFTQSSGVGEIIDVESISLFGRDPAG